MVTATLRHRGSRGNARIKVWDLVDISSTETLVTGFSKIFDISWMSNTNADALACTASGGTITFNDVDTDNSDGILSVAGR